MVVIAMLAKPASTRALLIAQASPGMGAARLSSSLNGELSLIKVGCSSSVQSSSLPKHTTTRASLIRKPLCFKSSLLHPHDSDAAQGHKVLGSRVLRSGEIREAYSSLKQKHFSTSGSSANGLGNRNETAPPNSSFNNQPPANNGGYPQQQQPPPPSPRYPQPQQPGYASSPNTGTYNRSQPPTGSQNPQQPTSPGSNTTHVPTNQNSGQLPVGGVPPGYTQGVAQGSNAAATGPAGGASADTNTPGAPRTSAAAEVIDKYLGPSTLKLEKRDDKAPPPPPPPPRRNYGPQGTQEKKSGKDLVAESAACAVIEKYLGPWPGFPPRDPKIDEYLDSLPENAACAAIDKYFGPYKPLFVFKNKENAENPPPPSRPPRNRMMSRARNRSWNASQQGASVDRPWTTPHQSGPNTSQGTSATPPPSQGGGAMPSPQGVGGGPPPQGAAAAMPPPQGSNTASSSQGAGGMPPSQAGGDVRQ